ncbi:ABC transporter substrate-binding protein [Brevundimonas sp. SL130]|uniref:ABC transporter substrate-binding protein n=1 Tax=Brevundimonas sp. SL130 TaxID=2995143 RepID=UPI00226D1042|nr:extracellular solute-binding protein [Brevundimonas sp. SL130]WAC61226.1 extracellular solute-binding protein [Brevundimonas sp. SL130]
MKTDRRHLLLGLAGLSVAACSSEPEGAGTAPRVRWLARREGALHILTNTSLMGPVLAAFRRHWPEIQMRLEDINSTRIAEKVRRLADSGRDGPDLVWSTAMDMQVKLINDGYAQAYRSPHRAAMPDGSVWRDQGYGLTAEPIVFAYNRNRIAPDVAPRSHAALLQLLTTRPEVFDGRVTLYDAEQSGVALMQLSADVQIYPDAWPLMEALGAQRPRLDTSGQRMMGQIADGRMAFVYNMNQSYGASWAARAPEIGLITPDDYHLSVSRVAFIPRNAAHPNAARLFLDFLLSREGQRAIGALGVRPVRNDVEAPMRPAAPGVRPIRVGPALLANLDQARRATLLTRWGEAMRSGVRAPSDPAAP